MLAGLHNLNTVAVFSTVGGGYLKTAPELRLSSEFGGDSVGPIKNG